MRKLFLLLFLLASSFAFSQTSAVTGHLIDPASVATGSRAFVRFELTNTGGNICRVAATGLIAPTLKDFSPNTNGLVSFNIIRNDQLTCGSTTGASRWKYTIFRDGAPSPACFLNVTSATLNLDSTACLNATATPVTTAPTDSVYARIDGTNAGFTGPVTFGSSLTVTGASTLAAVTATSVNSVQCASSTVSITAAYAALPSTGGTVQLCENITLASPVTLSLTAGKSVKLDFAGRTITCNLSASAVCIQFTMPFATPRYRVEVAGGGGVLTMTGATTSVVGMQFNDSTTTVAGTAVNVHDLAVTNFSTTSSIGMQCYFCQEYAFNALTFQGNTLGLSLISAAATGVGTIQNSLCNTTFQLNTTAAILQDTTEITFCDNTVQSNTATKPFILKTSLGANANIRIIRNHFENNGDTTANSRQLSFQPAAGKSFSRISVVDNTFNNGANFPNTATNVEATGASTDINGFRFAYNTNNSGATFASGFAAGRQITAEFDPLTTYDTGLDTSCAGDVPWGISFSPSGAAKKWAIYGGFPAQFDGFLVFRDCSAAANILTFASSIWDFQANLVKANQFQSVVATGTAPLVIASTTPVANLSLSGGAGTGIDNICVGCVTPAAGSFTTLQASTYERTGVSNSRVMVASDFTLAANTNLQAITGLSWTFPATAANYSFHCGLFYSQATAAVSDTFGIQAVTNAPTQINVGADVITSVGPPSNHTFGILTSLNTTTATAFVTFTPGAITQVFYAYVDGSIELGASANTVNIMASQSNSADLLTVKRGSYCVLY